MAHFVTSQGHKTGAISTATHRVASQCMGTINAMTYMLDGIWLTMV